ncbi:MAG: hypothetical protein ACW98X_20040 [Promethearchaeota archaeon]|jgi:hypothetical protein
MSENILDRLEDTFMSIIGLLRECGVEYDAGREVTIDTTVDRREDTS